MIELYALVIGMTGNPVFACIVGVWLFLPYVALIVLLTRIRSANQPTRRACWMAIVASLPMLLPVGRIPSGLGPFLLIPVLLALPCLAVVSLQQVRGSRASPIELVAMCIPWVGLLLSLLNRGSALGENPFS